MQKFLKKTNILLLKKYLRIFKKMFIIRKEGNFQKVFQVNTKKTY